MKTHPRTLRRIAVLYLAQACLLVTATSLHAQIIITNWTFESGTTEGWTLRSRYVAPPAPNDPTVAGDESLTGARLTTGLPVAGLAWSVGNFNQYDGQIRAVPIDGIVNPSDTNLMTWGENYINTRGQSNYLNTYALNQHGDNLHTAANDQIAKSPVITVPTNAVLVVWAFGGGNSSVAPMLDFAGEEEYIDNSGGVAVRSAADDSLLASMRTLAQGTLRSFALDLSAYAGQNVYIELVDAFTGGWGWLAIDEVQIIQNTLSLPPNAFTFEAEDFNYDGGQYINNPNLILGDANCYYQKGSSLGVQGVDYNEANPTVRSGADPEWRFTGSTGVPQTTNSLDVVRSQYIAASVADYDLTTIAIGEWWNYTRTFPNTNAHLYARVAAEGAYSIRVDEVSNPTSTNQTLTTRGWFIGTGTSKLVYQTVPLTDITGTNLLVLGFNGTPKTLRMTALRGRFNANFYALIPTNLPQNLVPVVNITSHTNDQIVILNSPTNITATASDDGYVTNVRFYAVDPVSGSQTLIGQDNSDPYSVNWTPTAPDEGPLTIRAVATDNAGLSSEMSVTVKTIDPTYIKVPTTIGNGADNDLDEEVVVRARGTTEVMQYRFSTSRHRIPVMRFDVSGYDLSKVTNATLHLWMGRQQTKQVVLRGILPNATNVNVDWNINTYVESELTYSNMPGMGPSDGVLNTVEWYEGQTVLIVTNTMYGLASAPLEAFGGGGPLTDYLRSQAGQTNIVIVFQYANNDENNLGRIMTKEATNVTASIPFLTGNAGDFAPYLRFKIAAPPIVITSYSLRGNQLTLNWSGGTGPYKVRKKTLITDAWTDHVTGIAGTSTNVTISLDAGGSAYYQVVGQ